ncbi:class A beta-lactamase [Vibrio sonorensis]|uniref:class A beta-lactamase n=1 Tax=Vibrio sonorensis TaxID=1004316 RepID=UPI0008D8EA66|nr:class A beta-lactamase [Vibrio sonorensis]
MRKLRLYLLTICFSSSVAASELHQRLAEIESRVEGRIGIAFVDSATGFRWSYRGNETFPVLSTFKPLACAKLLHDMDSGQLNHDQSAYIKRDDIVEWSPVTKELTNSQISLISACEAALSMSDNTATNIVLNNIGGPDALNQFLRKVGDKSTRLDDLEPFINQVKERENTTTPVAMTNTMSHLFLGEGLSEGAQKTILGWMERNRVSMALLRSVLPYGWSIADRSGSGSKGSRGITALIWKETRKPLVMSIYVTETNLTLSDRNQLIADIGEVIFSTIDVRP